MAYKVDPRKNWAAVERRIAVEADPLIRANLACIARHAQAEAAADFPALMATVSKQAAYTSFTGAGAEANSPRGKDGVAAYYRTIVESGCHHIEHDVVRIVADRRAVTTEGTITMAYPAAVLRAMGHAVGDEAPYYLYVTRLMIVWEFDAHGLVLCEDSYSGGDGFAGIAGRPCQSDEIYAPARG